MKHAHLLGAVAAFLIASCGTPGAKPDDMSAAEHEAAAAEHRAAAEEHAGHYDPNDLAQRSAAVARVGGLGGSGGVLYTTETYNPTEHHHRAAVAHEHAAAAHAKAAAALLAFEEGACGNFPPATRAMCPLLGQLKAVNDIPGGVSLVPVDDVNLDAWAAHIQCHVAYAATAGHVGMDDCPLFLRGVRAEKVAGGVNLVVAVGADPTDIAKLRQVARTHL